MKKLIIYTALILSSAIILAQGIVLGGNATFKIGANASFTAGSNTTFNGVVTNDGEIISYNHLDFVANRNVGNLRFLGDVDQNLSGDTLDVTNIEVNKGGNGKVVLLTKRVNVSGQLNVNTGVIQADDELDLIVQGTSNSGGSGFVEGKLVGLTNGQNVSFPMGLNGNANYVTLENVSVSNASAGAIIRVECQQPLADTMNSEEDVEDVSEDVEWILTSINGVSAEATLTINFSGVNLEATENITATTREPAILVLVPGDSLFRRLATNTVTYPLGTVVGPNNPPSIAAIESSGTVAVSDEPIRLAIAWVPVIDGVEFFVPNSFAPNAMFEENRTFRPFFSGDRITSVSMSVFNNLNTEVYTISLSALDEEIDLSLIGWDGRLPSTGQLAPAGVYYYTINLSHENGALPRREAGAVLLVD